MNLNRKASTYAGKTKYENRSQDKHWKHRRKRQQNISLKLAPGAELCIVTGRRMADIADRRRIGCVGVQRLFIRRRGTDRRLALTRRIKQNLQTIHQIRKGRPAFSDRLPTVGHDTISEKHETTDDSLPLLRSSPTKPVVKTTQTESSNRKNFTTKCIIYSSMISKHTHTHTQW